MPKKAAARLFVATQATQGSTVFFSGGFRRTTSLGLRALQQCGAISELRPEEQQRWPCEFMKGERRQLRERCVNNPLIRKRRVLDHGDGQKLRFAVRKQCRGNCGRLADAHV